jgi:hypothetical protein
MLKNSAIATSATFSQSQVRHADPGLPSYGEGWLAKTPEAGGGDPGSWNAAQICLPGVYSANDQVTSSGVDSAESM